MSPDASLPPDFAPAADHDSTHDGNRSETHSTTRKRRGNYVSKWCDAIWSSPAGELTPVEKLVALAHAHHADYKTGHNCRPGAALIAVETGLSERTVKRARAALEAAGWLVLVNKGGTRKGTHRYASLYRLARPTGDSLSPHTGDRESLDRCHSVPPPTQTTRAHRTAAPAGAAGGPCEVCLNGTDLPSDRPCVSCGRAAEGVAA